MKEISVFEINVSRKEYGEWQGTVRFPANGEEQTFCSFLELLNVVEEKNDSLEDIREKWEKDTDGNDI